MSSYTSNQAFSSNLSKLNNYYAKNGPAILITYCSAIKKNVLYSTPMTFYEMKPQNSIDINIPFELIRHGNHIYRVVLDKLPDNIHSFRGNCGYFFEYDAKKLSEIIHIISNKYQTLTYFGLNKSFLKDFVIDNKLNGIDRIVPIGQALDISLTWDGIDIIESLSRIVDYN